MNTNLLKWTLGTCLCTAGWLTPAALLQQADIAASPAWLLHLDCDALRPTAAGQYILAEMDKPSEKAKLAIFQTIFSFDLRTQLHGLTLYGTSPAPEDGVLIVYADFDPERLVALAQAAKGYQSSAHGQNVIHNWIDDKKKPQNGVQPRVYAAIQGNRVIFGQREPAVAQALDIIAGISPNLAGSKIFPDLVTPAKGTVIEAAAQKMKLPDSDPNAALLKMSQSVQLAVGESAKQFTAVLTLTADNDEIAGHLLSIAQGLVALGKLQTDKPESVAVANALTLQQDGSRVMGTLVLPADQVVQLMKTKAAQDAAKKPAE
jgi:hypothetical protein